MLGLGGLGKAVQETKANVIFSTVVVPKLNANFPRYGKVQSLSLKDGKLYATAKLCGLEDRSVSIVCNKVEIGPGGKTLRLSQFTCNIACVEAVLNDYASRTFPIEDVSARGFLDGLRDLV